MPEIRFHDIRHTNASILLMNGVAPAKVAYRLGQSEAVLLDTYQHYIPYDQNEETRIMSEAITPVKVPENWHTIGTRISSDSSEIAK